MPNRSVTGLCALAAASGLASADIFHLAVYNNAANAPFDGLNLTVEVLDAGSAVDFIFRNDSTQPAVVTALYFENSPIAGGLLNGRIHDQSAGVSFSLGATPPQPAPPADDFGGAWSGNLLSSDADAPGPFNGINAAVGEHLTFRFDLDGIAFDDVLAALSGSMPDFRIAQHVQSVAANGEGSVWTVIPSPAGAALFALGGIAALRRRR